MIELKRWSQFLRGPLLDSHPSSRLVWNHCRLFSYFWITVYRDSIVSIRRLRFNQLVISICLCNLIIKSHTLFKWIQKCVKKKIVSAWKILSPFNRNFVQKISRFRLKWLRIADGIRCVSFLQYVQIRLVTGSQNHYGHPLGPVSDALNMINVLQHKAFDDADYYLCAPC